MHISIAIRNVKDNLVQIVNQSLANGIPACILEMQLKEIIGEIIKLSDMEYQNALKQEEQKKGEAENDNH